MTRTNTPVRHGLALDDMTLRLEKSIDIAAPPEKAFDAMLDQFGPAGTTPDGAPLPLVLEPRPGGRWYRDLGKDEGHWWGTVQVIKRPHVLEIAGPMFMSYPVAGHIAARIDEEPHGSTMRLVHSAFGMISEEHRAGVNDGWQNWLDGVKAIAEK